MSAIVEENIKIKPTSTPSAFKWLDFTHWDIYWFDGINRSKPINVLWEFHDNSTIHDESGSWATTYTAKSVSSDCDRINFEPVTGKKFEVIFIDRQNFFVINTAIPVNNPGYWVHKGERK